MRERVEGRAGLRPARCAALVRRTETPQHATARLVKARRHAQKKKKIFMPTTQELLKEYAQYVREWNARGWSPATSTNYSARIESDLMAISQSGVDKARFTEQHFLQMRISSGELVGASAGLRSSAETGLHLALYRANSDVHAAVHTHTVFNTILSERYLPKGALRLEGYELLKAIDGYTTHESVLDIPVFANTQNIDALAAEFLQRYAQEPQMKAYLIAGHGLYTWGKDIAEAKRQLEALEFLIECEYRKLLIPAI